MKVDIFSTAERYGVICADPPWKQSKGGRKAVRAHSSGLPLDYRTIPLEEIERSKLNRIISYNRIPKQDSKTGFYCQEF